jgi:type II restriction enzyme
MSLNLEQNRKIEDVLKGSLRHKFKNYKPETTVMPFWKRQNVIIFFYTVFKH